LPLIFKLEKRYLKSAIWHDSNDESGLILLNGNGRYKEFAEENQRYI